MLQVAALESLAEPVDRPAPGCLERDRERRAAAFGVGGLDRVGQARAQIAFDLERDRRSPAASADRAGSPDRRPRGRPPGRPRYSRPKPLRRSAASVSAIESTSPGSAGCGGAASLLASLAAALPRPPASVARAGTSDGRDDRHVEADQEPRPGRRASPSWPRHDFGGLADDLLARSSGRSSGRPGRRAGAGSRGSRSSCRPSSAGSGCCSSGGSRSPGRCPRSNRRPASPSARGTGGRRPTATRRSAAALRRRSCRRPATTCRSR